MTTTTHAQKVGPYEILRVIGRGGMATVYEARHSVTGKSVALKVPNEEFASNPKLLRKFFDEANFAARVHHPNVVEVYEIGSGGPTPYMALELLQGLTIARIIRREKQMDVGQALEVARQTAEALSHIHSLHVHHKDIKPKNLMAMPDGRVKIMDFGVAHLGYWSNEELEGSHGTPAYLAPEQLEGDPTDERTDLYALGITLFEMIAGQKPFRGGSAIELRRMITDSALPALRGMNPRAPASVEAIIEKATAKNPENRYKSAREMSEALSRALGEWERAQKITVTLRGLAPAFPAPTAPTPFEISEDDSGDPVRVIGRAFRGPIKILIGLLACVFLSIAVVYAGLWMRGSVIADFRAHEGDVNALELTSDEGRLITAGADGAVRFWDMSDLPDPGSPAELKPALEIAADDSRILAATAARANRLMTSSAKRGLALWDLKTGKRLWSKDKSDFLAQALAPVGDGSRTLAGCSDKTARVFGLDSSQRLSEFQGHKGVVYGVAATRDGGRAFTGDGMGTVALWETATGNPIRVWTGHRGKVAATAISGDGKIGASGGAGKILKIWDMRTGKPIHLLKGHPMEITAVALVDDARRVMSIDDGGLMILWDVETGRRLWQIKAPGAPILSMAVSEDGTLAITGGSDGRVRVWRAPRGEDRFRLKELQAVLAGFSRRVFAGSSPATTPSAIPPGR